MPARDGTGPLGQGPMTGRGMGFCATELPPEAPLPAGPGTGFGRRAWGRGMGWGGRGWRNCYRITGRPGWARFGGGPVAEPGEPELLERLTALHAELELIRKRLEAVEGSGK